MCSTYFHFEPPEPHEFILQCDWNRLNPTYNERRNSQPPKIDGATSIIKKRSASYTESEGQSVTNYIH